MLEILPEELKSLANACPAPLYAVGGSVRDFYAELTASAQDMDICAPLPAEEFATVATARGFSVRAIYKNTGTVKLQGSEGEYEYSCFRSDKYVRGKHTPAEIFFTQDILLDAKRRDFTVNALYFDIREGKLCDPLGGLTHLRKKLLVTVDDANKVFGEDGLRLMRLARQAAQLGFTPAPDCLEGAKRNAHLIEDVSPERVFDELTKLLVAEQKCGVTGAPYRGLRILAQTEVLDVILPELTQGRGLAQRADFHKYDVLEHSLKAVYYAERLDGGAPFRLAALLHDVGKPLCMLRDGNAYAHPEEGERLAREILLRFKAPKRVTEEIAWLVKRHMYDLNGQTGENKLRRFLVSNAARLPALLALKQADFSACTNDTSTAPTCARWNALLAKMRAEGVPFSLKELAVNGREIADLGVPPARISETLHALFLHVAVTPKDNRKERLLRLAKSLCREPSAGTTPNGKTTDDVEGRS